jgi:heat shock protein HtpX
MSNAGWIVLALLVLVGLWMMMTYNGLVTLRQRCRQSFSDIDVQLKQRHDLIPNLVETVIRNRDAQLMVVAVIFAGMIAFFGDLLIRMWDFPYGWSPTPRRQRSPTGSTTGGDDGRRGGRSRDGGGGGALLAIAIAIAVILISWGISTLIRFALSRSRELLADAGSAELTKNPDALIRALRKIEGNARFDVPSRLEAFFIENPVAGRLTGLLATHPPIAARIEALRRYAGVEQELRRS